MDEVGRALERRRHRFVRYGDDCNDVYVQRLARREVWEGRDGR